MPESYGFERHPGIALVGSILPIVRVLGGQAVAAATPRTRQLAPFG